LPGMPPGLCSPSPARWLPPLLLALALLAPPAQGCVQCHPRGKNILAHFARLCARYHQVHGRPGCASHPWSPESFKGFALDEQALDVVTEKTHRVLRLMEINRTLSDLPKFWDWLHRVKLLEYSKEASAFNCSTCKKEKVLCWPLKKCYTGEGFPVPPTACLPLLLHCIPNLPPHFLPMPPADWA
uniref:IZUMO family member 3 n=1 Tax=Pelusios castaneus TaxID=367368 RepID=A0A8C8RGG7_9SAUR